MKFSERRAAQVAAYFIFRADGNLPVLKLMKLMYLAERESFARYAEPLIGDRLVSMDFGPVLSMTLNHINRYVKNATEWEVWIAPRQNQNQDVALAREITSPEETLIDLSEADLLVLDAIWDQYGGMEKFELADLTHEICPEWENPHGSATPITLKSLLQAVGYEPKEAIAIVEKIAEQEAVDAAFEVAAS